MANVMELELAMGKLAQPEIEYCFIVEGIRDNVAMISLIRCYDDFMIGILPMAHGTSSIQ